MADENNTGDEQFTPDGSMEPLSPQEADTTDYGLMDTGERIQRKDLQQEMRESYLAYALSVIVERALPDVRDGMKPVHRRVIYAMYDGGYRPDRGYNKCSRVVGDVMGKYHPHGDSAIYDTLVRMAQSWSMRNMLVDGQGNFGSPGDDPAAAMRYTECRMAPLAMEMVRDIDKDTVDFVPNYDGKTQEPTVLPARFPNLLVNGSAGIAVGMATNIPPHNMREVADGVHWALDHPDASREELLENLIRIIKGPDFPTGATILGHKGIEQAYRTGRGLITMRAVVNTEEINGRMCLVVTELPYQVNPDRLVVSIREAVRDGKIQGIADMRDETSGRTGQRLVLVLKRDAVPKVVLNNLYKHSQLQQTFGANMLALVDGVPRTLSLDAFIRHWVNHQLDVIARRTAYLKREAEERDHILQGYLKALDMLDEVIALIRASEDTDTARTGLMGLLDIDQVQADAILAMQLRTLTRMNRDKIVAEHEELQRKIADYIDILAKPERQRKIIGDELIGAALCNAEDDIILVSKLGMSLKFQADDEQLRPMGRQTAGVQGMKFRNDDSLLAMDVVPGDSDKDLFVVTNEGFAKRTAISEYRLQGRNGLGIKAVQLVEGRGALVGALVVSEDDQVMAIMKSGKVIRSNVDEVKRTGRNTQGVTFAKPDKGDTILSIARNEEKDEPEDGGDAAANGTAETAQSGENVNNADEA